MTPEPAPEAWAADERLRAEFTRAALDVTPGPVPLRAVRRAGLARRRRRTAVAAGLAVLGVVSAVAIGVDLTRGRPAPVAAPPPAVLSSAPVASATPGAPSATPAPPPARLVAAGERVAAGKGFSVWLTSDGKHWAGPDGMENFRSVVDGNIDVDEPGISHQSEGNASGVFHSGLYYGTWAAGRVELTDAKGRKTPAHLLELPGNPGWGVWYAYTGAGVGDVAPALYDRTGRLLAELPPF